MGFRYRVQDLELRQKKKTNPSHNVQQQTAPDDLQRPQRLSSTLCVPFRVGTASNLGQTGALPLRGLWFPEVSKPIKAKQHSASILKPKSLNPSS